MTMNIRSCSYSDSMFSEFIIAIFDRKYPRYFIGHKCCIGMPPAKRLTNSQFASSVIVFYVTAANF